MSDKTPKACHSVPCPGFEETAGFELLPWVPTVDELRQAGCAIAQPDGTFYSLRDGAVTHLASDGTVLP